MKRICKLNVFSCESFDYMESWYKDLAEKGLVVKEAGGLFSVFEKSEPVKRLYRILPESITKINSEEKTIYESSGWNYVLTHGSMSLFYNDNLEATEIFTDDDSWLKKYKGNIAGTFISFLFVFFWIFYYAKGVFWESIEVFDESFIFSILLGLVGLLMVTLGIIRIIVGFRFVKLMKNYKDVDHNIPYKNRRNFNRFIDVAMFIASLLLFIGLIWFYNVNF